MKKELEIPTKQIKSFLYDLTKDRTDKIDSEINKFLSDKDGEDTEIGMYFTEPFLLVTIVYQTDN